MKIRMETFDGTVVLLLCLLISKYEVLSQTAADSCIDATGIIQDGQTCAQLIATLPVMCYDTVVNIMCCQTCRNKSTEIQGCEFGDISPDCNSSLCGQYPDPTLCCGTCNMQSTTSTEATKTSTCSANFFKCQKSGECIPFKQRCDGFPDCQDQSDEEGTHCFNGLICGEGQVACMDGSHCVPKELMCNGIPNCNDSSDETSTICAANGTSSLSSLSSTDKPTITTTSTITVKTSKAMTTMTSTTSIKEEATIMPERPASSPKKTSTRVATITIYGTDVETISRTDKTQTQSMHTSTTRLPITTQRVNASTEQTQAITQPINVATKYVPKTTRRVVVTTPKTSITSQRLTPTTKHLQRETNSQRLPVSIPSIGLTTQKPVLITRRPPCIYMPFRSWACNSIYRGYFPNVEEDCRSFFVCEWGYLYYCQCPIFTRFSRKSLVCDWASSVVCDAD